MDLYGFCTPLYLLVVLVCTVLGLAAQSYINSTYKTWSKVRSDGDTGATVARRMLDANGCNAVGIKGVAGELTDHYNPQDNNLYLSDANRSGGSVASVAVACHEAGHAAQRQSGYAMMKVRTALVPVVNFTQNTWTIVLLMGLFMNIAGLTTLALVFFSFSVLFQLVTLPVEIDASRRAVAYIEQSGMSSKQVNGAKKVLTAAATHVAQRSHLDHSTALPDGSLQQKLQPITNRTGRRREDSDNPRGAVLCVGLKFTQGGASVRAITKSCVASWGI